MLGGALRQTWDVLEGLKDAGLNSVRLLCWCSGLRAVRPEAFLDRFIKLLLPEDVFLKSSTRLSGWLYIQGINLAQWNCSVRSFFILKAVEMRDNRNWFSSVFESQRVRTC